jgi:hypothetical protein
VRRARRFGRIDHARVEIERLSLMFETAMGPAMRSPTSN